MTDLQSAKYDAYQAIRSFFADHDGELQTVPAYNAALLAFLTKLEQLDNAIAQQGTDTEGPKIAKKNARTAVITAIMPLAAGVGAYAQTTGNTTLEETVRVNKSDLDVMGDDAFSGRVQRILDAATSAVANLLPYTINGATIANVATLFATWRTRQGKVRHAVAEGVKGTKAIARIIPEMDNLLEDTLDRLLTIASAANQELADEYAAVREIVDPATQTRALKVEVKVMVAGQMQPVRGASATINPGNLQKITTDEGRFYVQNLAAGSYTLTLAKPGYQPFAPKSFTVADGETTTLDEIMVADPNS